MAETSMPVPTLKTLADHLARTEAALDAALRARVFDVLHVRALCRRCDEIEDQINARKAAQ